jgi:tetratricopeptide (TPR) repeat protein
MVTMLDQIQHRIECPRCKNAITYAARHTADASSDIDLLLRILAEPEPTHVCTRCNTRIEIAAPFVFIDRNLSLLVYVAAQQETESVVCQIEAALTSWNPDWEVVKPHRVRGRLALKHAILQACNFASEVASIIPAADWLQLLAFWLDERSWSELGPRIPQLLSDDVAATFAQALHHNRQERTPLQVALRAVARQLHRWDSRFPDVSSHAGEEVVRQQAEMVQALAMVEAKTWQVSFAQHVEKWDRLAIRVCWDGAKALRPHRHRAGAAVALAQLGLWLAGRFGTVYQRAESAYQLAASLWVAGDAGPACEWFKAALPPYLDALCLEQALECYKQIGDLSKILNKPSAACRWYQEGIALAEMWQMPEHAGPLAANLPLATLLTGDIRATEQAVCQALALAADRADGYQIRLAALSVLRVAREQVSDDAGAVEVVRQMVGEFHAAQDWRSYACVAEKLIQTVFRSCDWPLAEAIIGEVLEHYPECDSDGKSPFQPDRPQLLTGPVDADLRFRLLHLGGVIGHAACAVKQARDRFAAAAALLDGHHNQQALVQLLHDWAAFLAETGEVEEAVRKHEQAISLHLDDTAKRSRHLKMAGELFFAARHGFIRETEATRVVGKERQIAALRAAVALGERAVAGAAPGEISPDLLWQQSSAASLLAWLLRREAREPLAAMQQASVALEWAQRSGEAGCVLEALEVLYSCQRDAVQTQEAAETLVRIVEMLAAGGTPLSPANGEAAAFCRWIKNVCALPGVALKPGEPERQLTAPPPECEKELIVWVGNAMRNPGIGVLVMLEHGPSLSRQQMQKLRDISYGSVTGITGSLSKASPEAQSWHLATLAKGGGSLLAAPEHWLGQITTGYLVLAGLGRQRSAWSDSAEWGVWVREALLRVAAGFGALGLNQLALRHCPRPPACPEPNSPCARWVPPADEVFFQFPEAWRLAAALDLQCGLVEEALQTVEAALHWAERRKDWNWTVRFRLARARCLSAANDVSAVVQELALCRDLLLHLPEGEARDELAAFLAEFGQAQQTDGLRQIERELLLHEGRGNDGNLGFEKEVERFLALAKTHATFGRLKEAKIAADQAYEKARQCGISVLEGKARRAQAAAAFAIGECPRAIETLEECLAEAESMAEPDLHMLGLILGTLGFYRSTWVRLQVPPFEAPEFSDSARRAAGSFALKQAIQELERSMALHRQLGAWSDVVTNLINLGLANALRYDQAATLRCYLAALRLCSGPGSDNSPITRYPVSCARIWLNLAATCDQLDWYPEASVISRYWLITSSELLRGLVSDENRLRALPERDSHIPHAVERIWRWVREGCDASQSYREERSEGKFSQLRAEVQTMCRSFGMVLDERTDQPSSRVQSARPHGSRCRLSDVSRQALEDKAKLYRQLFEVIENTRAQVLHEQLGGFLSPPDHLPAELRRREEEARRAWSEARRECEQEADSSKLSARIELCWNLYVVLRQVWAEMALCGAAAAKYANLRSGLHVDFETIRSSLSRVRRSRRQQ